MVARMTATSFHLAIDDGGEYLVVSSTDVALGHARGGLAEIGLQADLRPLHAWLRWRTSFHEGPCWGIEPGDAEEGVAPVLVEGRPIDGLTDLIHGEVVQLSARVSFRFLLPEHASSTAQLQFLHGVETRGTSKVLLFVPGPQGRIRVGARKRRHVPIAGLEHEVSLELSVDGLNVACEGGVREESPLARNLEQASTNKTVPCPPHSRIDLRVNARPSQRPPFGLSLSPLDPYSP
ncbi:MAG: hypothetical protein ACI841_001605 [Planctomycetota bacterium]|jgi:hypothetical protein